MPKEKCLILISIFFTLSFFMFAILLKPPAFAGQEGYKENIEQIKALDALVERYDLSQETRNPIHPEIGKKELIIAKGATHERQRIAQEIVKDAGYWLGLGKERYKGKQYNKAIEYFSRAVEADQTYAHAHLWLGVAYNKLRRSKEAIQPLKEAIRIEPGNASAHLWLGKAYYDLRRSKEAIQPLKEAIRIEPSNADAHLFLGKAYHDLRRYKEAIQPLKEVIRIKPSNDNAYGWVGDSYYETEEYQQALASFKKAAQFDLDPPNWYYRFKIGQIFVIMGQHKDAIEPLLKALELHPDPDGVGYGLNVKAAKVYLALGDAYAKLGELGKAKDAYRRRMSEWGGGTAEGDFKTMADYLNEKEKREDAVKYYKRLLLLAPNHFAGNFNFGSLLFHLKDYGRSIRYFAKAVEIAPDDVDAQYALAITYYKNRRYALAIPHALKATKLSPRHKGSFELLGRTYFNIEAYSSAIQAFERMIELRKFEERAGAGSEELTPTRYAQLAFSYAVIGDYSNALETFVRGQRAYPNNDALHDWHVVVAYAASNFKEAERIWRARHPEATGKSFVEASGKYLRLKDYSVKVFDLIYMGLWDFATAAERKNMLYASLRHLSLMFKLAGEYSDYDSKWVRKAQKELLAKIALIYQQLPLKQMITGSARLYAVEAQGYLGQGKGNQALQSYSKALGIAPWWPEGHYNSALIFGIIGATPGAVREMEVYLELAPNGVYARKAQKKIRAWKRAIEKAVARGAKVTKNSPILMPPIGQDIK